MKSHTLAIDLGGTHATCGLVRGETIVASETLDVPNALLLSVLLPRLAASLQALMDANGVSSDDVAGVGLGFPGLVRSSINKILSTNSKYEDATTTRPQRLGP
jgi:glucokinase